MKVCFVAAPLVARSGVYNSAVETIREARERGLDWTLKLGVSDRAGGSGVREDWLDEFQFEPDGVRGVARLAQMYRKDKEMSSCEVIVSLNPQSDMALALTSHRWVAYLRGLPWPARGDSSRLRSGVWKAFELAALRRSSSIWTTTTTLQREVSPQVRSELVPAGIAPIARAWDGLGERNRVVWAARMNSDKNPRLFVEALELLPSISGHMFGSGEMGEVVKAWCPSNVSYEGWASREYVFSNASLYVGTSYREAFGRSAVEAAMLGIPVVLAESFGAADLLFSDVALKEICVLPLGDPSRWAESISLLSQDADLRRQVSDHVHFNACNLTIAQSVLAIDRRLDHLTSA